MEGDDREVYMMKLSVLQEMEALKAEGAPLLSRNKTMKLLRVKWHPDKAREVDAEVATEVFQFVEECKDWFLDGAQ